MTAVLDGAQAARDAVPQPLRVGVWVDDALVQIDASYARRLRAIGVHEACLMVNRMNATRSDPAWELRASEISYARAAEALRGEGLEVVLTCWPRPARAQIAKLASDMGPLMRSTRAVAIEVDAEANWTSRHLHGFTTMVDATTALVEALRTAAAGARVEMTTFAAHVENGRDARIAPLVDAVFPQAYSVNERAGKAIPWDHAYGPGSMQRLTHAGAVASGARSIGLGLAAYEQKFAGHTPDEAMRVALDTARELGVTHVRYWSSKWIVGARGSAYAKRAISALTAPAPPATLYGMPRR